MTTAPAPGPGARGGVTTVIDFAIPYAGESLDQAADNWMKKAEGKALIDYTFHICITRWNEHKSQIKGMVDRGFTTFKEFMIYESEGWQSDDRALFGTLEQMREHGTMLLVHAESARVLDELIARHHTPELMARYGARLHPMTRPNFVEAEAIQRAVQWCEATGGQLYIVHMSTAEGTDIVRAAQARGVPVLAETCAQYLVLDDSVFEREDGHLFACCPQIKKPKDVERLWKGLRGRRGLGRLDRYLHLHPRAEGDVERGLDQDPDGASRPRDAAPAGLHPRRPWRAAHAGGAEHEAQHQPRADHGPLPAEGRDHGGRRRRPGDHPSHRDPDRHPLDDGDQRRLVAVRGLGAGGLCPDDAVPRRGDRGSVRRGRARGARAVASPHDCRARGVPRSIARAGAAGHAERVSTPARRASSRGAVTTPAGIVPEHAGSGAEDITRSPLWNPDLAPTPPERRTWSTYNIAALWIGMSVVITTYTLASGLMQQGMNWWQAMVTILLGNTSCSCRWC